MAFSFQRGGAFFLVICSRSIFFSAWPGHSFLSSAAGASAEQTSAAVGRQNACPSGAVLQQFRGRRQFEYAVRHTFPAKSRPVEAILYIHRPRSRAAMPLGMPSLRFTKCHAFASGNVLPSSPKMPCLRFTKYLAFVLENTPPSGMPRLHITKFPLSKGKSLVSVAEVHSFICSEVIFLSARAGTGYPFICSGRHFLVSGAGHSLICGAGASADQTAAAVGRQNACPSGAVLQPFRGRRQFEYAVRHTFPAKSRPLEAILYVHRPRSRKYPAFASGTALPPLHELPRLRFRECLAFTLRNFRSAKANLLCQRGRGIFSSAAWPVHPFICGRWKVKRMSIGRGIAAISRPSAV